MNPQNIAILVLFVLLIILIYQLYAQTESFWFNNKRIATYSPQTLEELRALVEKNIGKKISCQKEYNNVDIIIDTKNLNKILDFDDEENFITVQAGTHIKDICEFLENHGFALDAIPEKNITVAEACSYAVPGANFETGTMSDQIKAITFILSNGHVRQIEFDDPEFPAFCTSLGLLGIIYSVRLRCVNIYSVNRERINGKWNIINKSLIENLGKNPITFFKVCPRSLAVVIMYQRKIPFNPELPRYYQHLNTEPEKVSTDVAIRHDSIINAINDLLKLCKAHNQSNDNEIIVRFTGADYNSWLSPASGRSSAWILITGDYHKQQKLIKHCEALLLYKYSGRPNWHVVRKLSPYRVRLLYGISVDYVKRISKQYDPQRMFKGSAELYIN